MTEEEAVKILNYQLNMRNTDTYVPINYEAIETILEFYDKKTKAKKKSFFRR